jgi:hypothetical protein
MVTSVLLAFADGHKEFIDDAHVHGCRDGQLLIATGVPGAGMDAEVIRTVPVADLSSPRRTSSTTHPSPTPTVARAGTLGGRRHLTRFRGASLALFAPQPPRPRNDYLLLRRARSRRM